VSSLLARLNRRWLLRYRLEYVVALALLHAIRAVPPAFAWRTARAVGRLLFRLGVRRRTALENIARAFPDMPEAERVRLARRATEHFASVVVDIVFQRRMIERRNFFRRFSMTGWARRYMEEHGVEGLQRRARGVLFMTAHHGNWEISTGFFRMLGVGIAPVYRAPQNPFLERLLQQVRLDTEFDLIEKRGAVARMLERLEAGGNIGFLFDQEALHGLVVPFLGVPSHTHKTPALLARDHGVKILFGVMIRRGDYLHYEARGELLDLGRHTDDRDADLKEITADLMRRLEVEVRENPEQYLWFHRRWKRSRAPGAPA